MMRYNSPFGINAQLNKTIIRFPFKAKNSVEQSWSPSPLRRKNTSPPITNQRYNQTENKLKFTNLTVDSISFGPQELKPQKKTLAGLPQKMKLAWNMKKRQSIVKRQDIKRKGWIGKHFSLKAKQATIHSVHSPQQLRYSVDSCKQSIIDRSIENLTAQLKQLFNLRCLKEVQSRSQDKNKQLDSNLNNDCISLKKNSSLQGCRRRKEGLINAKQRNPSKKDGNYIQIECFPWNQNSKRRNLKERESWSNQVVSQWYDRNFSITLN